MVTLIPLAFFAYTTFAALAFHLAAREFAIILTLNSLTIATLMALRRNRQRAPWFIAAADLFPALLILVAYRESGLLLTPDPAHHLDYVFIPWDRALLQNPFVHGVLRAGAPWLQHYLEFAYLLCYPLVPLGVAAVHFARPRYPALVLSSEGVDNVSPRNRSRHLPAGCRRYSQRVVQAFYGHSSVVSHLRVDSRRTPLTPTTSKAWGPLLASADENASSSHPLPQGGEDSKTNSPLAPLGERGSGVRGSVHYPIVRYYAGYHTRSGPAALRAMDGFWAAVLPATLFCYAVYPFFPLTPPRLLFADVPGPHVAPLLRHWNFWLLDHYSVQACIFPSGHVAAATAVALAVRKHAPRLGALFLFLAASVAIATVYGRYHYAADAVAGALVGVAAYRVSKLFK